MDMSVYGALAEAFVQLLDPYRLLMLGAGVMLGLVLGVIPGIGGMSGMALLLPFTYSMDPYSAFAMLLGMAAVIGTADTIPAVLFGVPGTSGAQATVLDGNAMTKRGEAGRALSAAYTASLFGGLVGAALLALAVPVLRPIMMFIESPELLALSILGISMVAILSGNTPIRGLIAAGAGILLSMVGTDPQTGVARWTFNSFYLWEGLPILPLILGLFALPELADMAIRRTALSRVPEFDSQTGVKTGIRDALTNWWLVLRCGVIGSGVGALPGLGASVVDWIAYGHARQTLPGARESFGRGDVRGVIAPESANNAITAGSLVPTVAFGIPGSASMSILLGVFLIHGLAPGPSMLNERLDITYVMVWSIALANILGAGICLFFSAQLARIALLRYTLIVPPVIAFVYIGAFQGARDWGDLFALLLFGVIGWTMKQLRWPRPPMILGFVLGAAVERYLFISFSRYGSEWVMRPIVIVLFLTTIILVAGAVRRQFSQMHRTSRTLRKGQRSISFAKTDIMYLAVFAAVGYMLYEAVKWPSMARFGPVSVSIAILIFAVLGFWGQVFGRPQDGYTSQGDEVHLDSTSDFAELPARAVMMRAGRFLAYLLAFLFFIAAIGFLPSVALFVMIYMRLEGSEKWPVTIGLGVLTMLAMYFVFDQALRMPWPGSWLSGIFPALSAIPSV